MRLAATAAATDVLASLEGADVTLDRVQLGKAESGPTLDLRLRGRPGQDLEQVVAGLVARPDVVELGSLDDVED